MRVKLPEICNIQYGYAFDSACFSEDESFLPLVRIRDVVRGYSETYYCGDYSDEYIVREGDLLIGMDGEFNIARWRGGNALLNQRVCRVTANAGTDEEYLRFALMKALKTIEDKTAFVTVKHLSAKELNKLMLDVPPFEDQRIIANSLSAIERIIETRQLELRKLDDLIKARFVEMFGDPATNPFGWIKAGITTVVRGKASNGYFAKREEYLEEGNVAILGVTHVVNRMYSQVEGLPRTNASELDVRKYRVKYGDMLFCRSSLVAEGIGKASIVPENTPDNTLFECHVIRLPLNLAICVPEFMQVLSTTGYFRNQIISQSKTATMTTIGQDGIMKTEIILPPVERQKEFYSFVKQVDKSKVVEDKPFWKDDSRLVA